MGALRSTSDTPVVQWASRSDAAEHASRTGRRRRASFRVLRGSTRARSTVDRPDHVGRLRGPTSHEWGKLVRSFHGPIKGVDKYGRRYSALNPETFFWAHATFVEDIVTGHELTGYPLSTADKEALYLESIDWYRLYGVSTRPVPPDWEDR